VLTALAYEVFAVDESIENCMWLKKRLENTTEDFNRK